MIRVLFFLLLAGPGVQGTAQKINVDIRPDTISFTEGKNRILTYQVSDKSLNGDSRRANYIHPLYGPDGAVLTEDFPPDHLHHRGIFWAWHQLYIGDRRIGDGWEIADFSWEVTSSEVVEKPGNARALLTEVLWKSPRWEDKEGNPKAVVRENSAITVYPAREMYRQVDMEISLVALEEHMRIGGSEDEKGYGGFSVRIRLAEEMVFTGPAGPVTPQNLPVEARGWLDISGPIGRGGEFVGLSILSHPDNPGYPNPWILRSSESMQNAVYPHPGATPVPLSTSEPTTLRYRLLIHRGKGDAIDIPKLYADYVKSTNQGY